MTPAGPAAQVAGGAIGPRWRLVRGVLIALVILCVVAAVALHPAHAARYLSGDGHLAAASERQLFIAQTALVAMAAATLLVWRSWRTPTRRRERIVLGVAAVTASLLISGVATEAGLGVIHRFVKPLGAERHYFFQYDPVLGWKHRPGSLATFKNSLVRIDADGLRVPAGGRGPAHAHVLLLGDSQAFGDGVAAEDTFAARLERDVPGLRVLNASVIGYGTDQQLLYFEREGRRFAPEVTVVALNAYDLRDNLSTKVRSGYEKPRFVPTEAGLTLTNVPVPGDGLAGRLQRGVQHHSHLYRLLTRAGRSSRHESDEERIPPGQRLALEIYPDDAHVDRGLAVTGAILDRLAGSAQQSRSRLVVLFLPYQMDFSDDVTYAGRSERLVQFLQHRAAAGGFTFLDGRTGLGADRPASMFLDAMHLSPEGHQHVAALLGQTLAAEKLITRTHED